MNEHHWKLAKWAVYLTLFGYAPMVIALKVLRHGGAFDWLGR
jgi:hypothetical protein